MRNRLLGAAAVTVATTAACLLAVGPAHAGSNGGPVVVADADGWYGSVHFSHSRADGKEGLLTCDRRVDGVSINGQLRWQRANGTWVYSAVDGDPNGGEEKCGRWTLIDIPEGRPVQLRIAEDGDWYSWGADSVA